MKFYLFGIIALIVVGCSQVVEQRTDVVPDITAVVNTTAPTKMGVDQCQKDACFDNDYYKCIISNTSGNYLAKVGPVVGKCDFDCIKDSDCEWNQNCVASETRHRNYQKCVNVSDEEAARRLRMMDSDIPFR